MSKAIIFLAAVLTSASGSSLGRGGGTNQDDCAFCLDAVAETFKMVEEAPRYIETKLEKVCDWFGDDTRKACKSTIESDFAEIEEVIDLIVNNVTDPEMVCYEILCMCNSEMEKTGYFITDNELDSSSMVHVKDLDEKLTDQCWTHDTRCSYCYFGVEFASAVISAANNSLDFIERGSLFLCSFIPIKQIRTECYNFVNRNVDGFLRKIVEIESSPCTKWLRCPAPGVEAADMEAESDEVGLAQDL